MAFFTLFVTSLKYGYASQCPMTPVTTISRKTRFSSIVGKPTRLQRE
jgi:hypothetical protein